MDKLLIINAKELVTCSGYEGKFGPEAMNDLKVIENGCVAMEDGLISHVGTTEEVLKQIKEEEYNIIDASFKTVLPGFVDSHTHFVFGGDRANEYDWRLRGLSYVEIMNRGGGIINSVKGTEEASLEELIDLGLKRLDSMLSFGVTTVEGKSGYGLFKDTEIKQLKAMEACDKAHDIDVVKTFLGAHSLPPTYKGRGMAFIDYLIEEVMPVVKAENLAEFCDVFCEKNVFSVEESRKLLNAAKTMGFKLKLHADEIAPLGGSELAAELGATSADHLLVASDEGIKQMAKQKVVATCLPCTAFSLKEPYARARYMVDSGCAVAVATDYNPGSCPTESVPLAIALSTLYMGLTTEETITALTINGAAAIDRAHMIGSIDVKKKADLVIHDCPSYKHIPYHIGVSTVELVIKNGQVAYVK
jgi:imidazolonepropionase